jgi:hypothetical protein
MVYILNHNFKLNRKNSNVDAVKGSFFDTNLMFVAVTLFDSK